MNHRKAPELQVSTWLNTPHPLSLEQLRGKVVLIEAFQMLCPGCVSHGLPQATRVAETFDPDEVAVLGLHTVFEHHKAQGSREALEAFLHEYRLRFPVGIDAPSPGGGVPRTMAAYAMRGTPTQILIDREGNLRRQSFGVEQDLVLGAAIARLLGATPAEQTDPPDAPDEGCDETGCAMPETSP
ncbi:alkyl hydroperoxide reductase [Acidobacteria bacterium Mor1]|nr:alkyl hydroperoxide reductase [Acidobacteria bacterium Mor1]